MAIFQDCGRRHLGFFKFEIFNGRAAKEGQTAPNLVEIGQNAADLSQFFKFSRWRPPPSWIFEIFNGQMAQEGRIASPCQIWSKSVKPLPDMAFLCFQNSGHPPSWICYVCVQITHKGHLVVFITAKFG